MLVGGVICYVSSLLVLVVFGVGAGWLLVFMVVCWLLSVFDNIVVVKVLTCL